MGLGETSWDWLEARHTCPSGPLMPGHPYTADKWTLFGSVAMHNVLIMQPLLLLGFVRQ